MFIVTESGEKIIVKSKMEDDDYCPFQQTVSLYTDNTVLKDTYILELSHRDYFANPKIDFELELVKEMKFDHCPTKEEILWAMSANGCTRGDIAIVRKGFELDMG